MTILMMVAISMFVFLSCPVPVVVAGVLSSDGTGARAFCRHRRR